MIRLQKKSKSKNDLIENRSHAFNPAFYRGMHLETARRYTCKSQGGYLELPQDIQPHDEEEFCAKKSDFQEQEEKSRYWNLNLKVQMKF